MIDFEFLGEECAGRAGVGDEEVVAGSGQRDEQQTPLSLQVPGWCQEANQSVIEGLPAVPG
jgi:hypothetical protein